jgi:hypothetical protein
MSSGLQTIEQRRMRVVFSLMSGGIDNLARFVGVADRSRTIGL